MSWLKLWRKLQKQNKINISLLYGLKDPAYQRGLLFSDAGIIADESIFDGSEF